MSALPKVLCNSGPLMALGKLNRLDLLADVFEQVGITSGVFEEVVTKGMARGAPDAVAVRLFWHHVNWPILEVPPDLISSSYNRLLPGQTSGLATSCVTKSLLP